MPNETIRLNLDVASASAIIAAQNTDLLGGALARTRDEYGRTEEAARRLRETLESVDTAQQHGNDLRVAEAAEQARAQKLMRQALDETSTGLGKSKVSFASAAKVAGDWRYEILNAGRAAQDFAQGGVGGILNNIEGLLLKFPVAAGVVTAFAAVLYVAYTPLKNFFTALINGSNQVPEATGKIDKMSGALEKNRKELDELKDKQSLTNAELARYNELLGQQEAQEKALAKAKKEKADAEALSAMKKQSEEEEESETAANLRESFGGVGYKRFVRDAKLRTNAHDPELQNIEKEVTKAAQERKDRLISYGVDEEDADVIYRKEIKEAIGAKTRARRRDNDERAEASVTRAFKGDDKALQALIRATPAGKERDQLIASSAGYREAGDKEEAAFDAGNEKARKASGKRKEALDYNLDIQTQFNHAKTDRDTKAEAETLRLKEQSQAAKRQAEAKAQSETERLRQQSQTAKERAEAKAAAETERLRQRSANAAPARAKAAALNTAADDLTSAGNAYGMSAQPHEVAQAARDAVAREAGGDTHYDAIMGALQALAARQMANQASSQRFGQRLGQFNQQMRSAPVQSDTFFPGD